WCARSPAWAATCRVSCPPRWRPGSRASARRKPDAFARKEEAAMIRVLTFLAALVCTAPAFAAPPTLPAGVDPENAIVIDTNKGQIIIKLRTDLAPRHAERIKTLAREHFYDNVPFHRVIQGFMAQTGDGQNQNGTGGSKYPNLPAEFSQVPFTRGIVGM